MLFLIEHFNHYCNLFLYFVTMESLTEGIIDPSEEFYYVWLQVMTIPIFYNAVIIICR